MLARRMGISASQHWLNLRYAVLLAQMAIAIEFTPTPTFHAPERLGLEIPLVPTPGNSCHTLDRALRLRPRQQSVSLATCGFIGGNGALPVTCASAMYCATTSTYVGCCEPANCIGIFTTCYDFLGAACDAACQLIPENLVCPTTLPYCAVYQYEGGSTGYGCALQTRYTTTVLLTTRPTLTELTTTSATSTTSSQTSSPTPIPSSSGIGGGAIAGIAIGAAALVALIAGAIWFFRRKRKVEAPYAGHSYSPAEPMRSQVVSANYSEGSTYALPSPRTDTWKHSWVSQSDQSGYTGVRSLPGQTNFPVEMPAPHTGGDQRSELEGSQSRYS